MSTLGWQHLRPPQHWGGAADHREEYKIISTNLSQWVWKPWGSVCPMFLERTGFQLIDPTRDQGWLLLCPSMAIQRVNVYWILGSCPASELEGIHNLIWYVLMYSHLCLLNNPWPKNKDLFFKLLFFLYQKLGMHCIVPYRTEPFNSANGLLRLANTLSTR